MGYAEPEIIINGHRLTNGQAMTARVAITAFLNGMPADEFSMLGEIGPLYRARRTELLRMLLTPSPDTVRKMEEVG